MIKQLTYPEVAEYLNISIRKVQELVKEKQLKCIKIGRSVRFSPSDIEQFIEDKKGY